MNGFPSYLVSRHPEHWGVYMQSGWVVWTAFDMPPRLGAGRDVLMEDAALAAGNASSSAQAYMDAQRRRYNEQGGVLGFEY